MAEATLIALSGRSGTGKSTIARALARDLGGIWLRIDSIEQAIRDAHVLRDFVNEAGYLAAHAVALDNLRLGRIVIADCVNDWATARDAWLDVGSRVGAHVVEVEVVCSDIAEHRRRVASRSSEVPGLRLPDWRTTIERDYHPWDREHLVIDTAARSVETCVAIIREAVSAQSSPGTSSAASPASSTAPR